MKNKSKKASSSPVKNADLSKITAGPIPSPQNFDPALSRREEKAWEKLDERKALHNLNLRHILRLRRELAKTIPTFVKGYLVFVLVLLLCNSMSISPDSLICKKLFCINFEIPDSVLIALLTTTTVNVIGLYVIVAKYVFSPHLDSND